MAIERLLGMFPMADVLLEKTAGGTLAPPGAVNSAADSLSGPLMVRSVHWLVGQRLYDGVL